MIPREGPRVWGWLSGLGLGVVPWLAAGAISTFSGDPEATFPWALGAGLVLMAGWIVVASARFRGFGPAALAGSAIALCASALLWAILVLLQP
jgi:hypothetical protein